VPRGTSASERERERERELRERDREQREREREARERERERELREREEQAPPARVGFQGALRVGYAIPLGSAVSGAKMSDTFGGQVPFVLELGAKVTRHVFLGGFGAIGFGGAAGQLKSACNATGASCLAISDRLGLELQYHFQPAARINPWLGYGIAFEANEVTLSSGSTSTTRGFTGFLFADVMLGVDFRLSRFLAVGPVADVALGQYTGEHDSSLDAPIKQTAAHGWLSLGARVTFLP
jgi:hypothetical protein